MNGQSVPTPKQLTMSKSTWLLLLLLSILWGGSYFFSEIALRDLPPLTVVLGRSTLAAVALHLYLLFTGRRMPSDIKLWGAFFVMGLINNLLPFTLIVWGLVHIESGLASILNATTPIFTVILAHFLTRDERMTPNKVMGVALGLIGVVVLIGPESLSGLGRQALAQLAVVGAGVSYALGSIYGRRFRGIPAVLTTTGMLTGTATMMLPLTLIVDKPWRYYPSQLTLAAVIALALLSTAAAYLIYFRILAEAGATNVLLVTLLIPVSAIVLGALVLGERLHWSAFAGMGLILSGLLAVDGRVVKVLQRRYGFG